MDNKLTIYYGLFTAICLVVGTVIGSGVFFKAEKILIATEGNMWLSILSWAIGGAVMIICSYVFSTLSSRTEVKANGVVDYAEDALGEKYGYFVGWFFASTYYPTLTVVLAWLTARYSCVLFGWSIAGGECMVLTAFFLILSYAINTLSPIIAGKTQVSTTIVKLVPLVLMAVVGLIWGLVKGSTQENFSSTIEKVGDVFVMRSGTAVSDPVKAVFSAVCATAFAYEGWIICTSINAELKHEKHLRQALVLGSLIVVGIYVCYYIGLAGGVDSATMANGGQAAVKTAFSAVFGKAMGTVLFVFIIISCFGTLNGLMLGCCRGCYSIAVRNRGLKPEILSQVDRRTNMPTNSSVVGLLLCITWFVYFCGTKSGLGFSHGSGAPWFGKFDFDMSELPILTTYPLYIPIFVVMIKRGVKAEGALKSFSGFMQNLLMPILAILGSLFMVVATVYSHKTECVWYLIAFAVIMLLSLLPLAAKKLSKKDAQTADNV